MKRLLVALILVVGIPTAAFSAPVIHATVVRIIDGHDRLLAKWHAQNLHGLS